jgi:ornithine cyclodeaminase
MLKTLDILFLNREDTETLLPYDQCIARMRDAMASVSKGEAIQPIRSEFEVPDGSGVLGMMPGYMKQPEGFGIKVVTVFPANFGTEYGSHQGMVLLFDAHNGAPYAVVDGGAITAIRTAASSALATDLLARADANDLTVLGYGEQAETHIAALLEVRDLKRVRVWGRSFDKASAFAEQQSAHHGIEVLPVRDACAAVADAAIVCTTTAADDPIVFGEWLPAGVHLNVVGSSIPTTREVDSQALLRSKLYCDYRASLAALGGDYRTALSEGVIGESHLVGEIGDILVGACPGRESDAEITLFKSLGMVTEDLAACRHVYEQAVARGIGQRVVM